MMIKGAATEVPRNSGQPLPAQRPGLLGADPAQKAQHDVGVHEFGRPADILQAGPQLHHRQGPGRSDDSHGLVQGQ